MTYSPQHPGLGSQGLSASFELQRAIPATHRRHQVSAAVSPARSGNGRNQAETQLSTISNSAVTSFYIGAEGGEDHSEQIHPPLSPVLSFGIGVEGIASKEDHSREHRC